MNRSAPREPLQSGGLAAWTRGFHRPPLAEEPSRRAGFFTAFHFLNRSYYTVSVVFVNGEISDFFRLEKEVVKENQPVYNL